VSVQFSSVGLKIGLSLQQPK